MVIVTHPAEDISGSSQADGLEKSLTRTMRVEGESLAEIMDSPLIPQVNSRHPQNSIYYLKNISFSKVGNLGRRMQFSVELSYSNGSAKGGSNPDAESAGKDPWDWGASNLSITHSSEQVPVTHGYDEYGQKKLLTNTAGMPLKVTSSQYIKQISFTFCVKAKMQKRSLINKAPINSKPSINREAVRVAGVDIPAYCGMLLPMNADLVTERDDKGDISRRYWQIKATIICNYRGHIKKALNVGTLANTYDDNGKVRQWFQPIHQYTPWTSIDSNEQTKTKPKWGSIDDVMAAQKVFDEEVKRNTDYQGPKKIPHIQITEPLPLDKNGCVYDDSIINPVIFPPLIISWFERLPESWAKFNLPKEPL